MSEDSSGGVWSSVSRTASTIVCTGSASASRMSSESSITVRGRPESSSRPRTSTSTVCGIGKAEPATILISSALGWPIARFAWRRT